MCLLVLPKVARPGHPRPHCCKDNDNSPQPERNLGIEDRRRRSLSLQPYKSSGWRDGERPRPRWRQHSGLPRISSEHVGISNGPEDMDFHKVIHVGSISLTDGCGTACSSGPFSTSPPPSPSTANKPGAPSPSKTSNC